MSYLIKVLLDPALLALFLLILIWILGFTRWRKPIRRLALFGALILGLVYFGPLPALLSQPLATRFSPIDTQTTPEPEWIIVLGGMTEAEPIREPGSQHPSFTGRSERFLMGIELARQFPNAKLVFTGWSGPDALPQNAEATRLGVLAISLGIPREQLIIEPLAQTTSDHPVRLEAMAEFDPNPDEVAYIVTSATHMPRAMGSFRQAGWSNIYAAPTDYPFPPDASWFTRRNPAGKKVTITQEALGEWAGLISYRWRGLTDSLLPGP